jgi:hypothetical protein
MILKKMEMIEERNMSEESLRALRARRKMGKESSGHGTFAAPLLFLWE